MIDGGRQRIAALVEHLSVLDALLADDVVGQLPGALMARAVVAVDRAASEIGALAGLLGKAVGRGTVTAATAKGTEP